MITEISRNRTNYGFLRLRMISKKKRGRRSWLLRKISHLFQIHKSSFSTCDTSFSFVSHVHISHAEKKSSVGKIHSSTWGSYPGNGIQPVEECLLCFHCAQPEVGIYKRKKFFLFLIFLSFIIPTSCWVQCKSVAKLLTCRLLFRQ